MCLSSTLRLADKRSASTHSSPLTLCLPPPALTVQTPVSGKLLHLRSVQCCHHEAIPSCLLHAAGQINSVEYLRVPSCRLLGLLEGKPFVLTPTESNHGGMMSLQCVSLSASHACFVGIRLRSCHDCVLYMSLLVCWPYPGEVRAASCLPHTAGLVWGCLAITEVSGCLSGQRACG